jgi:hypothetical protein
MEEGLDPGGSTIFLQHPDHVLGPVGSRKDSFASFFHCGESFFLEEGDQVLVEKAGEDVVEEFSVVPVVFDEGLEIAAIGQVAPTLAGEAQFDPHPSHFLQEEDLGSELCGPSRRHQPRSPSSDDNDIRMEIQRRSPQRHRGHREIFAPKKIQVLWFFKIFFILKFSVNSVPLW